MKIPDRSTISTIALVLSVLASFGMIYSVLNLMGAPSPICDSACEQARTATAYLYTALNRISLGGYVIAFVLAIYGWGSAWKTSLLTILMPIVILGIGMLNLT